MAVLTDGDKKILPYAPRAIGGFHMVTDWYMRGWEPLPYQWAWHQLDTMNTTFLAGIASGKTAAVAASYLVDCLSIPYFRALNTSVTEKQASLAFDMVESWIEGNPKLEHLVENISHRPFKMITFKNYSEWEFRTAGHDGRYIRGSEYDRANFDEAGLDVHGLIIKVLRGRLRGVRADNTIRMARLDVTTSPTDVLWLKERFDWGWPGSGTENLEQYRSLRVTTWENIRLTRPQVAAMEAEYPPDMVDVELGAMFPDYGLSFFPSGHLNACLNVALYDKIYEALNPEDPRAIPSKGYRLDEDPRHGVTHYEVPVEPGRIYVMGGDPGVDSYPRRNAPVVIVADVTTKPYKIVYFWWGAGRGSYKPFLQAYRYALDKYGAQLKGIDATGTQKALDELGFEEVGIETDKLNFGTDKPAMLNALSLDVSNHRWEWPAIKGLQRQMGSYTIIEDKKLPQDIVMTLAEISHLVRFLPAEPLVNVHTSAANYRNTKNRTTAGARRG